MTNVKYRSLPSHSAGQNNIRICSGFQRITLQTPLYPCMHLLHEGNAAGIREPVCRRGRAWSISAKKFQEGLEKLTFFEPSSPLDGISMAHHK